MFQALGRVALLHVSRTIRCGCGDLDHVSHVSRRWDVVCRDIDYRYMHTEKVQSRTKCLPNRGMVVIVGLKPSSINTIWIGEVKIFDRQLITINIHVRTLGTTAGFNRQVGSSEDRKLVAGSSAPLSGTAGQFVCMYICAGVVLACSKG